MAGFDSLSYSTLRIELVDILQKGFITWDAKIRVMNTLRVPKVPLSGGSVYILEIQSDVINPLPSQVNSVLIRRVAPALCATWTVFWDQPSSLWRHQQAAIAAQEILVIALSWLEPNKEGNLSFKDCWFKDLPCFDKHGQCTIIPLKLSKQGYHNQ